jgi:hypothetical protein
VVSGSTTLGIAGRWLQSKILDTIGSLQRQTVGEPYTSYQINPHHSRLKMWDHELKKK